MVQACGPGELLKLSLLHCIHVLAAAPVPLVYPLEQSRSTGAVKGAGVVSGRLLEVVAGRLAVVLDVGCMEVLLLLLLLLRARVVEVLFIGAGLHAAVAQDLSTGHV